MVEMDKKKTKGVERSMRFDSRKKIDGVWVRT